MPSISYTGYSYGELQGGRGYLSGKEASQERRTRCECCSVLKKFCEEVVVVVLCRKYLKGVNMYPTETKKDL